jgi:hypothetical protein
MGVRQPLSSGREALEIFQRGDVMVDPLMRCKGDHRPYLGMVLGDPRGSQLSEMPGSGGPQAVTVEVACLYLLEAIHRRDFNFASSALLTDLREPPVDRRAGNSAHLVQRAWEAAGRWYEQAARAGFERTRQEGDSPVSDGAVAFW